MDLKPGDRVESRCTRCKDLMGHIIVTMVDSEILKVECCACKSIHKYYPVKKKEEKKEKTLRVRAGQERSSAVKEKNARTGQVREKGSEEKTKRISKSLAEIQENWKNAINSSTLNPIPYNMNVEVNLDSVVEHSIFGIGIVTEIFPPDKADFLFSEGVKSLRCKIV